MKGLELSRRYYETYIHQLLSAVPQAEGRIAAGLVGEGSQCFGFDDKISQDHDFGPGFCIWLSDEDYAAFGTDLQAAYDTLPDTFCGYSRKNIQTAGRAGVMKTSEFYARFTGLSQGVPKTLTDWLLTPEHHLAAATNGQVFQDDTGVFTEIRRKLQGFYPEDVRRKKIAARAAVMAQAGQYNLLRSIKRNDVMAAMQALNRFTEASISMGYLLHLRYTPFYKWSFAGLQSFDEDLAVCLERLPSIISLLTQKDFALAHQLAFQRTEEVAAKTAAALRRQRLSRSESSFLQDHLDEIMSGIEDSGLRSLHPAFDCQN